MACVGTGPLQCMFVTTTDDDAARDVLHGLGHEFIEGEPVMVEIPDRARRPRRRSAEKLAEAGVHGHRRDPGRRGRACTESAFCVDDEPKAREALGLHAEDLRRLLS